MELDPTGLAVIAVQVAAFLLLLIGVYPSKSREETANLIKHGVLSSVATALNLATVLVFMIPVFIRMVTFAPAASLASFPVTWVHAVLGVATLALAFVLVAFWLKEPLGELGCAKTWRLMKPVLAAWAVTIVIGAYIHLFGLM